MTRAQAWGMRSLLHLARSELAELGRWSERAHAHSTEYNVGYWRAFSSLLRGWMQARGGELEAGRRRVDEGLQAYLRSGALLGLSRFYVLRAGLCLMAGDRAGASRDVEAAEQHVEQTGERYAEAELYRFKGRLLIEADPAGARAAFERAVAVARGQSAVLLELRAATELAELERTSGTRRSRPRAWPSCASASRRSRRCATSSAPARCSRRVNVYVCGMALALLAAFWLIIAAGLLFAPDDVLKASPAARRYGAIGCFIFAASCIIALGA